MSTRYPDPLGTRSLNNKCLTGEIDSKQDPGVVHGRRRRTSIAFGLIGVLKTAQNGLHEVYQKIRSLRLWYTFLPATPGRTSARPFAQWAGTDPRT